jgi:hypothetical protein
LGHEAGELWRIERSHQAGDVELGAVEGGHGFVARASSRRGRRTSSPPQLGHTCAMLTAQAGQKVHS